MTLMHTRPLRSYDSSPFNLRPSGWPEIAHTRQPLPSVRLSVCLSVCLSLPLDFRISFIPFFSAENHYSIPYITAFRTFGQTFFVAYDAPWRFCCRYCSIAPVSGFRCGRLGCWVSRGQRSNLDLLTSTLYRFWQSSGSLCVVAL